jgi:hypothetical protein
MANPHTQDLRFGVSREQAITRSHQVIGHLERAGIDFDGDDLAVIASFHQRANLLLVHLLPSVGMLFSGVLALAWRHCSVSFGHLLREAGGSVPNAGD